MTGKHVLMHCDARAQTGMGHLMRCVGLAQQALLRGWTVTIAGDLDETARGVAARSIPGVQVLSAAEAAAIQADVIHLDRYGDVPEFRTADALVSNMQDGRFGARAADLAIDANLGAEDHFEAPEQAGWHLAGTSAAVIREQVLRQRAIIPNRTPHPRLLVVMGGTDPEGLTSRVVKALDGIPTPLDVTVVSREAEALEGVVTASHHRVTITDFVEDLPALARQHTLAISAAGTSVWDFACMGLPMALVCVVANQRPGYSQAIAAGLAYGLGDPPHADLDARIRALGGKLIDGQAFDRERELLMQTVDGLGAWRIVSAWEQLTSLSRSTEPAAVSGYTARRAESRDAQLLYDWRNDEATRSSSRATEPLDWHTHTAWLDRCLADPQRMLLVVEHTGQPVGTVRWDRHAEADWEVSITLAPEQRGRGRARGVLAAGESALDVGTPLRMLASIRSDNTASQRLFVSAGYLPHAPADASGFTTSAKWRFPAS